MKINIGSIDRVIRIIVGIGILGAGYYFKSWWALSGLVRSSPPSSGFVRPMSPLDSTPVA